MSRAPLNKALAIGAHGVFRMSKQSLIVTTFTAALFLVKANHVSATDPLMDLVEWEGATAVLAQTGRPWLELPPSEKLNELRQAQRCSAVGLPGRWKISEGKLWLLGLRRCAGDIPLDAVYEGSAAPRVAEWITGKLTAYPWPKWCRDPYVGPIVYETKVEIRIEKGAVVDIKRNSEAGSRRTPPRYPESEEIPFCRDVL